MITLVEIDGNVQGESSTSLTIGTGEKVFVLADDEPFVKGMEVTATELSSGLRTGNTMTGIVTRVAGTTLVVSVASVAGSGTIADWVIDGERTIYLGTSTYVSKVGNSPELQEYSGFIQDPGDISQYLYSSATSFGKSTIAKGDIVCTNKNDELSFVEKMGFNSGGLRIFQVADRTSSLDDAVYLFSGVVLYPDVGLDKVTFSISDRLAELDKPAQEVTFLGTNSGATGIEGSSDGIKGQIKPFGYGGPSFHVPATLVNESSRIYAVNFDYTGATEAVVSFDAVYDEGLLKTKDTAIGNSPSSSGNFATLADLQGATIGAGFYATCIAEGLFRFSGAANGVVTCGVTFESGQNAAEISKSIIERLGFTYADYVDASFTTLGTANNSDNEIYCGSDTNALDLIVEILGGVGANLFVNTYNKYEVSLLENPDDGVSLYTFYQNTMANLKIVSSRDPGDGIPPKQIKINYKKNYRPFSDSEFAGAVTPSDRLLFGPEWKEAVGLVNENIVAKHTNAPIFTFNSHFTSEANTSTELARQNTLRQTERKFYYFDTSDLEPLNLSDIITIENPRINLSSGKKVVIMGKDILLKKSRIGYLVWG